MVTWLFLVLALSRCLIPFRYHTLAVDITGIAEADSTLINGKGRYPGGPQVDLSIINVMKGKRYRFRIISISCDPNFVFSIDNHDLTIIETEGTSTKPYTVNSIQILAGKQDQCIDSHPYEIPTWWLSLTGQRYSVVLNANQTIGNYWIRALPNSGNRNLSSTFEGGVNSAILRYLGAPIQEPTSTQQTHIVPPRWVSPSSRS